MVLILTLHSDSDTAKAWESSSKAKMIPVKIVPKAKKKQTIAKYQKLSQYVANDTHSDPIILTLIWRLLIGIRNQYPT
jgi:hypothetical protein